MDKIVSRLLPGEKLVWSGRPGQGIRLSSRDGFLIPFSLLWGGFAIFWEAMAMGRSTPIPMRLWGVPFVLMGIYLIIGRFFVDAWVRRGTVYAVTNRRILIGRSSPFSDFTVLNNDQLSNVNLKESISGRGTIRFGLPSVSGRSGFSAWTPALDSTPQFLAIADARSVFDLIQNATRSLQS